MNIHLQKLSCYLNSFSRHEKIILFGDVEKMQNLDRITEQAGFKVAYMVGLKEQDGVRSYMDLLYETDDFFVWIVSADYHMLCDKLKDIGLNEDSQYQSILYAGTKHDINEKFYMDVHLGHAPMTHGDYDGFKVFGSENGEQKTIRIATIGGSTSDSIAFPFKSWSEILYGMLREKYTNCNVIIYSGGVAGYNSSQELIKLLRDVLNLNPDIVISYSGVNDMKLSNPTPWITGYQRNMFDILAGLEINDVDGGKVKGYFTGLKTALTPADNWLRNARLMHAVCQELGISFFSMLQPALREEQLGCIDAEAVEYILGYNELESRYSCRKVFMDRLKAVIGEYDYIHDLTGMFDGKEHVYMDDEHVNEEGNRIIADKIYDIVFEDLRIADI